MSFTDWFIRNTAINTFVSILPQTNETIQRTKFTGEDKLTHQQLTVFNDVITIQY